MIEVILVAIAKEGAALRVLVEDWAKPVLPSRALQADRTTLETAIDLLKGLTGVEARLGGGGWAEMSLAGLEDSVNRYNTDGERVVGAVYQCYLPLLVKTKENYRWANVKEADTFFLDHGKILKDTLGAL